MSATERLKLMRAVIEASDRLFVVMIFVTEEERQQREENMALWRLAMVNLADYLDIELGPRPDSLPPREVTPEELAALYIDPLPWWAVRRMLKRRQDASRIRAAADRDA